MPAVTPKLAALLACAVPAALEGLAAGGGIRRQDPGLLLPRRSPTRAVWTATGLAYYLMCFLILSRLLAVSGDALRRIALAPVAALMLINALWGYWLFRHGDQRASLRAFVPYALLALSLGATLWATDRTAAIILSPYLVYLAYAAWWMWRVRRLND